MSKNPTVYSIQPYKQGNIAVQMIWINEGDYLYVIIYLILLYIYINMFFSGQKV